MRLTNRPKTDYHKRVKHLFLLLLLLLIGCEIVATPASPPTQSSNLQPTPTLIPITPTPPTDSGWTSLQTGLDRRTINLYTAEGALKDSLYILRIDPAHFRFDVGYSPREPKTLRQWQVETDALITVNGGYFTPEYLATGLTIIDGVASGVSYTYGGMFWTQDGFPTLQPLATQPYSSAQPIEDGLQAFPMLVIDGEASFLRESADRARRTVVGMDTDGNVILIVTARSYFTLPEFSTYLAASDLALNHALNLDGATSSGILLTEPLEEVPALVLLPTVLLIRPK